MPGDRQRLRRASRQSSTVPALVLPLSLRSLGRCARRVDRDRATMVAAGRQRAMSFTAACVGCGAGRRLHRCAGAIVTVDAAGIGCASRCCARTSRPTPRRPAVVMTRIVTELAELGHEVHVVTALPWYRTHCSRSRAGKTRWYRREATAWGSITRVNPFAGSDKRNLARRAAGFVGFSALAGLRLVARRPGRCSHRHVAAADHGPHRLGHASRPAWPAGLQHPGRVPRRSGRDRGDHEQGDHRRGQVVGAGQLPPRRSGDRAQRRPARQRRRQGATIEAATMSASSPTSSTPTPSGRSTA